MTPGHAPSPELLAYHRAVAEGGVGMTTVAYAAVEQSGLSFSHQLWLRREVVPGLRELTDAVHASGARASIQIGHSGNMAKASVAGGRPLSPSGRFNLFGPTWPRAMDAADLARLPRSFAEATRLAREAGFDAVEVHAGHGYLLSQFLSPWTNRRRDGHGGSLENRARLARECVEATREAAGDDLAVLVKTNLRDGFEGGIELDEAIAFARILEGAGAHALVLSAGFVSRAPMEVMGGAMPTKVMGALMGDALGKAVSAFGQWLIRPVPFRETYFLEDAKAVRAAVALPLVYVGGATSRAGIDRALAAGFDAVAIARALIRETDFVARLERDPGATSPCDHCNYCAARIYTTSMSCHHVDPVPEVARPFVSAEGCR